MAKKNLKKGIFITFEGPEGSGKSTHVRLLCSELRRRGLPVVCLREPGGTKIGEKIRNILLDAKNKDMDAVCEMLLYQAARAQLVREKILSALRDKKIVILDRFLDATICYQGYGAGIDIKLIKQIGKFVTGGICPDLTILLDIEAGKGLKRSGRRDRIEKKSLEFHRRVRKGYLKLARENPHRIKIIPVMDEISQTQGAIREVLWRLKI
ncbi:MAG: dTMP kinase [Candidatus Omnitrophota bacterium]|nr:MAG: dTMP kinase [Candidatus Omnitrophota bacterium]